MIYVIGMEDLKHIYLNNGKVNQSIAQIGGTGEFEASFITGINEAISNRDKDNGVVVTNAAYKYMSMVVDETKFYRVDFIDFIPNGKVYLVLNNMTYDLVEPERIVSNKPNYVVYKVNFNPYEGI